VSAARAPGAGADVPRPRARKRLPTLVYVLGALGAAAAVTVSLARARGGAPTVDRATLWVDTVKRGEMLREVEGTGALVPEQIRWLTATTAARVADVRARSGAEVGADSVVVVLENPDLVLQSLEADRQESATEAELANLEARLRNERLQQESQVVDLDAQRGESARRATADDELAKRGFLSKLELAQSRGRADALEGRVKLENRRLGALDQQASAQLTSQRAQVGRLKSIAQFRHEQLDNLSIRAGVAGVLEDVPLQVGQWVTPGTVLGKVAEPSKLKAEIRIGETLARDVHLGQVVSVDTRGGGIVPGKVTRMDGSVQNGTVKIDVGFDGPLPAGARPDLSVDARIEIERLDDTLFLARPAVSTPQSSITLFRVEGGEAVRVPVRLGRASVKTIEVAGGLAAGDSVVLSDTSAWSTVDRIRLK
jgi:multidrug resistance efflux pump